jgi:hypothetical protein
MGQMALINSNGNPFVSKSTLSQTYSRDVTTSLWTTPGPIFAAGPPRVEDVSQLSAPHCAFLGGLGSIVGTMNPYFIQRVMFQDGKKLSVRLYTAEQFFPLWPAWQDYVKSRDRGEFDSAFHKKPAAYWYRRHQPRARHRATARSCRPFPICHASSHLQERQAQVQEQERSKNGEPDHKQRRREGLPKDARHEGHDA